MSWVTDRCTSRDIFHANDGSDITSANLRNLFTFIGKHANDTANTLFVAGCSIEHATPGGQLTSIDADEDEFTNEWVTSNLEGKSGQWFAVASFTNFLFAGLWINTDSLTLIAIKWTW